MPDLPVAVSKNKFVQLEGAGWMVQLDSNGWAILDPGMQKQYITEKASELPPSGAQWSPVKPCGAQWRSVEPRETMQGWGL